MKNIKLLEEHTEKYLQDLWISEEFLDMIAKAQFIKERKLIY